ncbi:uncharacterized protein LOC132714078 isoform X2 [Ruditapes philippinarum]|uniref:uncharacterized protein LOC132714078 isoform X2 n=1 Tax=Ruditapes philippinarum TaxID=129788 RepID=UPI00295BD3D0|nr:uncharacterized protein LOC132714078 isoform X2 [Ruditapes philippinarum]
MGGLSCVAGKPENEEPQEAESVKRTATVQRSDSQKPWNRNSQQVYCGEPRKKSEDKPPDDAEETKQEKTACDADNDNIPSDGTETKDHEELKPKLSHSIASDAEILDEMVDLSDKEDMESESKDSVPDIMVESVIQHVKFYPPPHIAPFDPTIDVKKRPRSLDSAENQFSPRKSRPLSYSPGLLKTKHPRSLHSINETVDKSPRKRPKSMDMTNFFEVKGFDIHTQKLRRVLTQKVREKIKEDMQNNKCTIQPGQVKYLEEGPSRCFQPSQMAARKKKNRDLKVKEIAYLKKALTKPRMKFSKSLEIFFQHNIQYMQYDPLLEPRLAQPSNPWITDDETMWDINRDLVDVPTVNRIKKWAVSFEDLLHDKTGEKEFEQFLKKEYSIENIAFYRTCKDLVTCPNAKVVLLKTKIEKEFLTAGAIHEVNVDCKTLEKVTSQLKEDKDLSGRTRYIFQPAMEHVYALMKKDSYSRFLRSDQYNQLLDKSQTHYTKKKFFNFGSNRKKTPSPLVRRRGSASSEGADGDLGGPAYHSYSTGNLRELDEKPRRSQRQSNSPSVRRRTENMDSDNKLTTSSNDPRRRSNLEVPRSTYQGMNSEGNRKSEAVNPCLAISVPRTNVVTPWEGES